MFRSTQGIQIYTKICTSQLLGARVDEWGPRDCVYEWYRRAAAVPRRPLLPPVRCQCHCPGRRCPCGTHRGSRTRPATCAAHLRREDCYCPMGCSRDRDDSPRSSAPRVCPRDSHSTGSGFFPRVQSRLHLVLANTWLELPPHEKRTFGGAVCVNPFVRKDFVLSPQ